MNVWIGGTFDLLHPGHIHLLREAGRLAQLTRSHNPGWQVTVAVNSDEFVERYKGERPIQSLGERLTMIESVKWVDHTQVNEGNRQDELILASNASVILIGDDWAPPKDYPTQIGVTVNWLLHHRIDVIFLPRLGQLSSSQLKAAVRAR